MALEVVSIEELNLQALGARRIRAELRRAWIFPAGDLDHPVNRAETAALVDW